MIFPTPPNDGLASVGQPEPTGLAAMGIPVGSRRFDMSTYSELLRDPRWQKKRLKALEAAGWKCKACGDSDETLHVHHIRYIKGRKPWEYELNELKVLCAGCHEQAHDSKEVMLLLLADAVDPWELIGLCAGYLDSTVDLSETSAREAVPNGCPLATAIGVLAGLLYWMDGKERAAVVSRVSEVVRGKPLNPAQIQCLELLTGERLQQ